MPGKSANHTLTTSRLRPKIEAEIRRRGIFPPEQRIFYIVPAPEWDRAHHVNACLLATELGKPICGAKRNHKDQLCRQVPIAGRNRCKNHGGLSLSGELAPKHQGRGYAMDMPTHLAERFEKALLDPDLASLGSELALVDTRIGDLMSNLSGATNQDQVDTALELLREIERHLHVEKYDEALGLIEHVRAVLSTVGKDAEIWDGILDAVDKRRKLASEERKREDKLEATMTAKQAMVFVAALKVAIREEVPDDDTRARLGLRLAKLLGENTD